ncbi:MAG: beta-Ala-His dipeptidase [Prevotellaceae bacterium]|nr:beta-Ala-His dipeptidase [Prevotellaceae bacterium]
MKQTFYDIFSQLNAIPRPSHHEEKVADFLCSFAEKHGLRYRRDKENCVVIEKDATPGYENADTIVILNHMDMVAVAADGYKRDGRDFNPLTDPILPYIETQTNSDGTQTRWMKAHGTSLGADNGMGLSMALAILTDDSIVHGPLEVLTTTNEEDGMSGAEALSNDFIHGRKVINLDSEAYDEITTGAAGACLQVGSWKAERAEIATTLITKSISIEGGLGGHSGVDINKGRCNAIKELCKFISSSELRKFAILSDFSGGNANASIASWANVIIAFDASKEKDVEECVKDWEKQLKEAYKETDSDIRVTLKNIDSNGTFIQNGYNIIDCIAALPCGVQAMRTDMPGTVMTSNNIGMLRTDTNTITVSCHTRSFDMAEQNALAGKISDTMRQYGAEDVAMLMNTGAWMEREDSPLLALTCQTFRDVLGFEPKKVAMHFVLEAAYYVEKYPGVEIASIGPRIIEPHSPSERVDLDTADDIWKVTVELLKRLAEQQ